VSLLSATALGASDDVLAITGTLNCNKIVVGF
jgi:hypothetical protein